MIYKLLIFGLGVILCLVKDVPKLIVQGYWKELAAYLVLMALASSLAVLQILEISVPSPVLALQFLLGPYN